MVQYGRPYGKQPPWKPSPQTRAQLMKWHAQSQRAMGVQPFQRRYITGMKGSRVTRSKPYIGAAPYRTRKRKRSYGNITTPPKYFRPGRDRANVGAYVLKQKEIKFVSTTNVDTITSDNTYKIHQDSIVELAQGNSQTTRIGNQVRFTRLDIAVTYSIDSNATTANQEFRLLIYLDKQPNGSDAAITTILDSDLLPEHRQLNYNERITILCDKQFNLDVGTNIAANSFPAISKTAFYQIPLNILTTYTGTTAAMAGISTNNIGYYMAAGPVSAANAIVTRIKTKTFFEDSQ